MNAEAARRLATEIVHRLRERDCCLAEEDLSTDPSSPWAPRDDDSSVDLLTDILVEIP